MREVRPERVARDLGALPGREPGIDVGELPRGALFQHRRLGLPSGLHTQLGSTALQRLDRFLERQIVHQTVIDMPR